MYQLTLHGAPQRRDDEIANEEDAPSVPSIGAVAAEQKAIKLEQLALTLEAKAVEFNARAEQIFSSLVDAIDAAKAETQKLWDEFNKQHDEYQALYAEVEEAWQEWDEPSDVFDQAWTNAPTDFESERDDILTNIDTISY